MKTNITVSIDVKVAEKAKKKIENLSAFVEEKLRVEVEWNSNLI